MTASPLAGQTIQEWLFKDRERTDFVPQDIWVLIPIATYALWSLLALLPVLAGPANLSLLAIPLAILELIGFLLSITTGYLVYTLVNRRNIHMAREQALFAEALDSIKSRTRSDDLKTLFPLSSAEHYFSQLVQGSGERSGVLWGLLAALPYAGWLALIFVLWFLSEDWKKHEVNEELLLQDLDRSLVASGRQAMPGRERPSHFGNAAAFLILSLILLGVTSIGLLSALIILSLTSLGIFPNGGLGLESLLVLFLGLVSLGTVLNYGLYKAILDPAIHFQHHQRLESALFSSTAQL
jgi:hypothetical protein